ncbi:MAG TPA: pirin family protein [Oligoflexia bacterium]|nr:pirin family protein [Oligoflexia bacterium]HMP47348.1 pirin family protein [Oligoflexia bacterium]
MLKVLKSEERGRTNISWLDSRHSFSFGDYHNSEAMHYSDLRVINEDIIAPGQGFGMHPHKNMEIVTFVLSGSLIHRDSLGSESVLRPGIIQKMSAGKGILHSEHNYSNSEPLHLLQIWIIPEKSGIAPSYNESEFDYIDNVAHLASPVGQSGQVTLNQDAHIYAMRSNNNQKITRSLDESRKYWIQVVKGEEVSINGSKVSQGDAVQLENVSSLTYYSEEASEILMFDLRAM